MVKIGSKLLFALTSLVSLVAAQDAYPITTWAPITEDAANPPPLNAAGYRVQDLTKGAYMVTDNQYQALFFVSQKGVILIDAPPTIGKNLLYAIGNITDLPVTHFVYSHAHADHAGGAFLLGDNVTRIGHSETKSALADSPDPNRPLPDVVFDDHYTVCSGNQTVKLAYEGPNHQAGNIFIYAPKQKVLMLVDVIFPAWAPFSGLAVSTSIPGYIKSHEQVLKYDFDVFVGGHLTRSGSREDVLIAQEYILDLKANCHRAIELTGLPPNATNPISVSEIQPAAIKANPGNGWAVFDAVLGSTAQYCSNQTNEKWLGRIAGVDVYGESSAFAMVQSIRIDFGFLGPFGVQP